MTYIPFRLSDSVPETCEIDGWTIMFSERKVIDDGGSYYGYEGVMAKDLQLVMFTMDAYQAESAYLRTESLKQMIKEYS